MSDTTVAEGPQGGLYVHPDRDKHVFKAPAPRASVLGEGILTTQRELCLRLCSCSEELQDTASPMISWT